MSRAATAPPAGNERRQRGVTLIEVLVAFFILFVVTLAVLQMLSMAYMVNLGALIRTDLTYRAQRVVETIRLQQYLSSIAGGTNAACCPLPGSGSPTVQYTIPSLSGGACDAFWGPDGANVMEPNARYSLTYSIDANGRVAVQALPLTTGANVYLGPAANKAVVYVATLLP
ncbi:MAG: prepilin-type N-terminal cleavage/methylation domain-containing protein [Thermoanaerobaculaceae bacterium]|nr:prepilin-type N-terminal cleavage/methylation domain-containing protein [Thermoanaerobaculaceae bacterium]